jgi:glycosyltransferase involved in cell wall biosynthesis
MDFGRSVQKRDDAPVNPRVSVIIIFLNGEDFFAEAIESVLAQDYRSFEVILVDDGSGPAAIALAKRFAAEHPSRVRYMEHPGHANRGMSASRNAGTAAARGDLVAFIDADDAWLPSKLTDQVAIIDAHPEVELVAGAANYWRSWQGGEDEVIQCGPVLDAPIPPPQAMLGTYPFGKAEAPCPSTLLARKSALVRIGGFEESFRGMYEDQAFLAKAHLNLVLYYPSCHWLNYRQHARSCSSSVEREGRMSRVRVDFAGWFQEYLRRIGVRDRRVWRAARWHWCRVWFFHTFRMQMLMKWLEKSRTFRRARRQYWKLTAKPVRRFG